MPAPPSAKALVPFVSVENMMRLVRHVGVEAMLIELEEAIEVDFARWDRFEKTPTHRRSFAGWRIELMPISDGELYSPTVRLFA
jgi:ornithine cyclodeaminase